MLKPVIFANLYDLNEQLKGQIWSNPIGICPNPDSADRFREIFQEFNWDFLTIFKFVSNLLSRDPNFNSDRLRSKSELLLTLTVIWREQFSESSVKDFKAAVTLFTELRSYFLDSKILESILHLLPERFQKMIFVFWKIMEELSLLDEHSTYAYISERLRTQSDIIHEHHKPYELILIGFNHFTGIQIDFIKALAIKNDVYVVIPAPLIKDLRPTDWPLWLFPEIQIISEKDYKYISTVNANILHYTTTEFLPTVNKISTENAFNKIVFAKTNLTERETLNFSADSYYKMPINLFSDIIELVKLKCQEVYLESSSGFNSLLIDEFLKKLIEKTLYFQNCGEIENFRYYKVIQQLIKTIKIWQNLSSNNKTINEDLINIFLECTGLDLPRNFIIPLKPLNPKTKIFNIQGIEFNDKSYPLLVVAGKRDGLSFKNNNTLPKELKKIIATMSPMRSGNYERSVIKFWIGNILGTEGSCLLLEKDIEEQSEFWKEILVIVESISQAKSGQGNIDANKGNLHKIKQKRIDPLNRYIEKFKENLGGDVLYKYSPSRIQTFLDCPRKFYFSYIDNKQITESDASLLEPQELGSIQHEVIRRMVEKSKVDFDQCAREVLNEHIEKESKSLESIEFKLALDEIIKFARNGVTVLKEIKEVIGMDYVFEKQCSSSRDYEFSGRIDCLGESSQIEFLIDFKRSKSSVPSKVAVVNFEKIQLWSYLARLNFNEEKAGYFGYLCLENVKDSIFFKLDKLKSGAEFEAILEKHEIKVHGLDDFNLALGNYKALESQTVEKIKCDKEFMALPADMKVCTFCKFNQVCLRGLHDF